MARAYRISPALIPGFLALKDLSENEVSLLANFLDDVKVGASRSSIRTKLAELNIPKIQIIGETAISLGSLLNSSSIDEIIESLEVTMLLQSPDQFTEKDRPTFAKKIRKLLEHSQAIKLTFKAVELLAENDKTFVESRVISDVRVLFENDKCELDGNAVIFHQLRIEYRREDGSFRDFYSLDLDDLKKLKSDLERAIDKHALLIKKYGSNTNFIDVRPE